MGNKIKFRAIWNVAISEFIKWITNPRIIMVGVLIVFIHSFAVLPMLEQSDKYGEPLNIMEPFIAVGNSGMLALFLPLVFLLLISDFPIMGGNTLFFINRTGKLNWFFGQIVFIIISIFAYIGTVLISCMFMSKGFFSTQWRICFKIASIKFIQSNSYNKCTNWNYSAYCYVPVYTCIDFMHNENVISSFSRIVFRFDGYCTGNSILLTES